MSELLWPSEVGKRLGVSRLTVYRMAEDGRLRVGDVTAGGHRRFKAEDVEALARELAPDGAGRLRAALEVYRRAVAAGESPNLVGPHVLLAAAAMLAGMGRPAGELDMSDPESYARLARLAMLDRRDAETFVEVGERMAELARLSVA